MLVLTHFHWPEPCAAANRVGALTRVLDESGFDVHVVTGAPSFPSGKIAREDRAVFPKTSCHGPIRLTRVWTYASTTLTGRSRILNWLSVASSMTAYCLMVPRKYDIVIVTIPPITLALPAFVAAIRHRARLVVDVRDVFPDVAIKMGYWHEGGLPARIVGAIVTKLYRKASLVLCVTTSARAEILARGSEPAKTYVASNGFDPMALAATSPYTRRTDEFVAAFVGNMGLATGLDVIVDAAVALREEKRIRFVLAGGGADQERIAARIADERLENIVMLGVVSREVANALIADADVAVIPLRGSIVDSLPTKIFDALMLECPVICCASGEAREFIERSNGGVAVQPDDGRALAEALRVLLRDEPQRKMYAARGRAYVQEHFDRTKIMRSVASRVYEIVPNSS